MSTAPLTSRRNRILSLLMGSLMLGFPAAASASQMPAQDAAKAFASANGDEKNEPQDSVDREQIDSQRLLPSRPRDRVGPARANGRWRNPSKEDIALFMEVVSELNPEWSKSLGELGEQDEEAFRTAVASYGRRLWQLVELRKQNPGLYTLRIREIRTRKRLQELGVAYRQALSEQRPAQVARLFSEIQLGAREQIDLQMRVRGEELAAMADALERLRQELLLEATERARRTEQLVQRVIEPPPVEAPASSTESMEGRSVDEGSTSSDEQL